MDAVTVGLAALLFVQCLGWLGYALIVAPEHYASAAELAQSPAGRHLAPATDRAVSVAAALAMVVVDWWGGLGAVKRSVGRRSVGFTLCAVAHAALLSWSVSLVLRGHQALWLPVVAALPVVLLGGALCAAVPLTRSRVA
ncbi:MAG: hypothetical protein HOV68_21735 [Streptomycetaceae bacterium]|nr:hypothetical protein [Streptomycetaceae bacterium]